jgi:protein AATF/BFR2
MSIMSQEPTSKKRKSKPTPKNKLFATLHSLEQTDSRAAKKRKASFQQSIKQSRAANEESKLNGSLVELRILIQRSLSLQQGSTVDGDEADKVGGELDGLLENLLVARRQLMGHRLEDSGEVDYSKLIQENDQSSTSDDEDDSTTSTLTATLQKEYAALATHWKTTLNKHHSALALHSGLATTKFQSKAVDVSFWEQVQSAVDHDRLKKDRTSTNDEGDGLAFDDSKLYQQMLKDFISGGGASTTSKKSGSIDPAKDAAERLKRAMRKKSGGDVDLSTLFDPEGSDKVVNGAKKNTVDRKASKGRKIRYVVHPKLVNFTFPVARSEPMIQDDVWFRSLFGGAGRRS